MEDFSISLCSRVMNRNFHLNESLPTWIKLKKLNEIIIVDWSSAIPIKTVVDKYQNGKIFIIRVENKKIWDNCTTRNLGIRFAKSDFIFTIDADIKPNPDILDKIILKPNRFYAGGYNEKLDISNRYSSCGTSIISREVLLKHNGFNEDMKYICKEDSELYHRLSSSGYEWHDYLHRHLSVIEHDNNLRIKNAPEKDYLKWNDLSTELINKKIPAPNMQKMNVTVIYPDGREVPDYI